MKPSVKNTHTLYAIRTFMANDTTITIGKLGRFTFEPGYYVYVGSAKKISKQELTGT